MENFFSKVFTEKCLFCGNFGSTFCPSCLGKVKVSQKDFCLICQRLSARGATHPQCRTTLTPMDIFCCFEYEGLTRECIKKSKYYSKYFKALKDLTAFALNYFENLGGFYSNCIVIPIPLNPKKHSERGFNQAQIIAQILSIKLKLKVAPNLLKRSKITEAQYKMNKFERIDNLKNAFTTAGSVRGLTILLVDDISTSGATFIEASATLMQAGATSVHCFSLAKRL